MRGEKEHVQMDKISILTLTSDSLTFELHHASSSMANALRRAMINDVPTVAIDGVTIIANSTDTLDDIIEHHLSMLPVDESCLPTMNLTMDCPCGSGCAQCMVVMRIVVHNTSSVIRIATSQDIMLPGCQASPFGYCAPIPLVSLRPQERIAATIRLKKGVGRQHSKWNPVTVCFFRPMAEVVIDRSSMTTEQNVSLVAICPAAVFRMNDSMQQAEIEDVHRCIFCRECTDSGLPITVSASTQSFLFFIETNGNIRPEQILQFALEKIKL